MLLIDSSPGIPDSIRLRSTETFGTHLASAHLSPNTVRSYVFAAQQFLNLYRSLSPASLQLYKIYLLEHYQPQTVNLRIRALNCYLEYCKYNDCRISMIKIQQKTYAEHVISEADYEYLKSCLIHDERYLYYFIIRFMAATGARVSELIQIRAEDVINGYIDICSKDNKFRRLYIPALLQSAAKKWLTYERRTKGDIFLNRFGNRITPGGIRSQLKKFSYQYGLNPLVVHPHSFRHRFAKSFIERCPDISLLSDLLGHESLETTRIYLRRTSTEQQQLVNTIVDW